MATTELIIPIKGNAHKTAKDFKGVDEILAHMSKRTRRKVNQASKKLSEKRLKIEESIEQDIDEYEFFDADNLNLHVPPVTIEEVEFEIVEEKNGKPSSFALN